MLSQNIYVTNELFLETSTQRGKSHLAEIKLIVTQVLNLVSLVSIAFPLASDM